ncbi:MAG: radical SAM protein [Clostridia bacterium]|nr:radical SAM protein [Clostridia bacterium]
MSTSETIRNHEATHAQNLKAKGESMATNFFGTTNHMNVILTNQCNRNCIFCIARKNTNKTKNSFLSLSNVEKAIEFCKKEDIKTIALTGGEPTLHPNILEIAKMFRSNGFEVAIYTNYDFSEKVKKLDGIVNRIFFSYYGQEMPRQANFENSQIIITTLLLKNYFKTIADLDDFIYKYRQMACLLFTVPVNVNDYCEEQTCEFLEEISKGSYLPLILPDGTIMQLYNGCLIKRTDLPKAFIQLDTYSYKMRLDGEISHFYTQGTEDISKIQDVDLRNALLSTHNPKTRRAIIHEFNSSKSK